MPSTTLSGLTPRPCVNNMTDINKTLFGVGDVETRKISLLNRYSALRAELEAVAKELAGGRVKHLITDDLVRRWAVDYGLTYITIDGTRTCLHMDFGAITTRYLCVSVNSDGTEFPVVFQGLFAHPYSVDYYFGSNKLTLESIGDAYNKIPDYAWTEQVGTYVSEGKPSHPHVSGQLTCFTPSQCCVGSNRFDHLYSDIQDASSLGKAIHVTYKWLSSVTLGDNYRSPHSNLRFSGGFGKILIEHLDVIPREVWTDIFLTGQKWLKALRMSRRTDADFIDLFRKYLRCTGGQISEPPTQASHAATHAARLLELLKSKHFKDAESSSIPALRNLCSVAREYATIGVIPAYFKTQHGLQAWYMAYCYLLLKMHAEGSVIADLIIHEIMTYMMTAPPLVLLDRDFSYLEHAPENMKHLIPEMP